MSRCPTLEQLEGFLNETASEPERTTLSQHIDRCAVCQAKLDGLTSKTESLHSPSASAVLASPRRAIPRRQSSNSQSGTLARLKENPPSSSCPLESAAGERGLNEAGVALFSAVAGYEILSEIGRGGMGVVYKARHVGLDRLVALKMILAGPHAGDKELARFRQEAEAVARLRHPNIIQIYDIGESEGRPYLALEFVDGDSLAHLLLGAPQPYLPAARLVETLAGADHSLRPSARHRSPRPQAGQRAPGTASRRPARAGGRRQISIGQDFADYAGGLLSAVPKITDFGLAKRLDSHHSGTHSGEIVGTPSYMALEQAAGHGKPSGPCAQADVLLHALGAFSMSCSPAGLPFRGPSALDTVLQVLHEDPVRPSHLRPDLHARS